MTGFNKSAYNSPTKAYRVQIRHKGMYYDEVISGQNDEDSLKNLALGLELGSILEQG